MPGRAWETDRAASSAAAAARCPQALRPTRPLSGTPARCSTRSWPSASASSAGTRQTVTCRPRHRRGRQPRGRPGAGGQVPRPALADRVFELAWTHSQVLLRQLNATEADTQLYARLASRVLYSPPAPLRAARACCCATGAASRACGATASRATCRSCCCSIERRRQHGPGAPAGAGPRLLAHEGPGGRPGDLERGPRGLPPAPAGRDPRPGRLGQRGVQVVDRPGRHLRAPPEQIAEEDRVLLQAVARAVISDDRCRGSLAEQLVQRAPPACARGPARRTAWPVGAPAPEPTPGSGRCCQPADLRCQRPGGFTPDGREYVITTRPTQRRPRRGSTCWPTRISAPWSPRAAAPTPGARTPTNSASRPGTTTR
jgi:cyclic beta-1,2-glucan synthetase